MSFPKLPALSLCTSNFDELIPCSEHTVKSLLTALRAGCPEFNALEEKTKRRRRRRRRKGNEDDEEEENKEEGGENGAEEEDKEYEGQKGEEEEDDGDRGGVEWVRAESIDGQGLMSNIYRFTIGFRPASTTTATEGQDTMNTEEGEAKFDAILKITTTKKLEQIKSVEIDALRKLNGEIGIERKLLFEMSQLEANFYEMVIPRMPAALRSILPRVFAVKRGPDDAHIEQGFVLMEDLGPQGVMPDLYDGLRREQVESAIVHLATFHAHTMTLPAIGVLDRFRVDHYGKMEGLEEEILGRVLGMGSSYFLCHEKTLASFLKEHHKLRTDVHIKYAIRPVICHGDFWANNLFFNKKEEDGTAGDALCAIIDWQTAHLNTGLNDVLRLIFSGVNAPLREQMMWQWLDLYFDTVQAEAKRLGIDGVEYGPELRRQLYQEQRHFELCFSFLALPTLFPGAKTAGQQRNLQQRIESLFEECRPEYDMLRGKRRERICNYI